MGTRNLSGEPDETGYLLIKSLGADLSDFYAEKICPASRQGGCTFLCIIW